MTTPPMPDQAPTPAYTAALAFVLRWEGGYVDRADDPGGATNLGVTQAVYDAWRQRQGLPTQSVARLQLDEAQALYACDYWVPAHCPALPAPLDLLQFDSAVNMGIGEAVRLLQQAVGSPPDGAFGPATQRCTAGCDPTRAAEAYCDARAAHYRELVTRNPRLAVFLTGWLNRVQALRRQAGLPGAENASDAVDHGPASYPGRVPAADSAAARR